MGWKKAWRACGKEEGRGRRHTNYTVWDSVLWSGQLAMTMLASMPKRVDMEDGNKLGALHCSNCGPVLLTAVTILRSCYRTRNQRSDLIHPSQGNQVGPVLPQEWVCLPGSRQVGPAFVMWLGCGKPRRKDWISGMNRWLPLKDLYWWSWDLEFKVSQESEWIK